MGGNPSPSGVVSAETIETFRRAIARRIGLRFDDTRDEFLGEVLRRRARAVGRRPDVYLRGFDDYAVDGELGALATELTIPETYFFRNIEQFHAFGDVVLPERLKVRDASRELRVLSAGCATGEEAYTLAIILRERLEPGWHARIDAVDLNPDVLDRARRGRFSPWSLRETPAAVQERWFAPDGRGVVLDDAIRGAVTFEQRNLADENADLWPAERYDVIFFRNVVMYFTPEGGRALVERIAQSLAPGGYLFLGHAETLRGLSLDFQLCHTHGTFYYRRRAEPVGAAPLRAVAWTGSLPTGPGYDSDLGAPDAWVDTIRLASERVARLTAAAAVPRRAAAAPTNPPVVAWDLGAALDLLRSERFAEALALLDGFPSGAADDADVLLLRSVLLAHAGLLDLAETACRHLLAVDDLSAGAHYVLALCREGAGDLAGAVDHDRMAAYLDPRFAMPRLHLGLLARRAGDTAAVCRELEQAASLLETEDASRLLLFGGGFGRAALIALCRTDSVAAGATA